MKKILALLFVTAAITSVHSQDLDLGWSFGELGWSHGFADNSNYWTAKIMNIYFSFEAVNLTLKVSVVNMASQFSYDPKPWYASFFPAEIIFIPAKFEYANLELYAKAAWETAYSGDIYMATKLSDGLLAGAGVRLGFVPINEILGYRYYMISVFAEYTFAGHTFTGYTFRNEFKAGLYIDIASFTGLSKMGILYPQK